MDLGVAGVVIPDVPGLVEEELRPREENVIDQLQHMVVETVLGIALNKTSVTLTLVQVKNYIVLYLYFIYTLLYRQVQVQFISV